MKKILFSILLFVFVLLPINVNAAGYISTSTKTLTIEEGSTKKFTIVAYNAIGDVTIKSDNTDIATVNVGFYETGVVGEGKTYKKEITVKGISVGTTKIYLDVDGATFDRESLVDKDQVITVNVVEKKPPVEDTRSKNNNLKSLTIEGYELTKIGDNNYSLIVSNSVISVKVLAELEDDKAKVSGTGVYDLKIGDNNISIVVTAENGSKKTYKIKVTRKDGYYLEDLDALLDSKNDSFEIILNSNNNILSKEDIDSIRDNKKIVKFDYFDDNKKLIYSWIIDGNLLKQSMEFSTNVKNVPTNDNIYEAVNYADGLYLSVLHNGNMPKGIKIRVYVEDKYKNDDFLNVYKYNGNTLGLVSEKIKVTNDFVEFSVLEGMDYFITMSDLDISKDAKKFEFNAYLIIAIAEFIVIIILVCILVLKKKKKNTIEVRNEQIFLPEDNIFTDGYVQENNYTSNSGNDYFPPNNN